MTIIDTIHNISHENCNKIQASKIVGLSSRQLRRIEKKRLDPKNNLIPVEKINRYLIYFCVKNHKRGEMSD